MRASGFWKHPLNSLDQNPHYAIHLYNTKQPHYQLVAVAGVDIKVYGHHLRMSEQKHIASSVGTELDELPRGPKHAEEAELSR